MTRARDPLTISNLEAVIELIERDLRMKRAAWRMRDEQTDRDWQRMRDLRVVSRNPRVGVWTRDVARSGWRVLIGKRVVFVGDEDTYRGLRYQARAGCLRPARRGGSRVFT